MRIGIDARWIFPELSGIGIYTRELIRQLALLDKDNRYILFFDNAALKNRLFEETNLQQAANFHACLLPFGLFSMTNQLHMPGVLKAQMVDVYHSPNYLIPLRAFAPNTPGRVRCVTNLHDLIPLMFPEYTPRSRKRRFFPVYRWLMRQVVKRSDIIITGSDAAREDVIRCLRVPPERHARVLAIADGVADHFTPQPNANRPEKKEKTILWVGRPDPYKNLSGLIQALAELKKKCSFPIMLRWVGAPDARYPEPMQLAAKLEVAENIVRTGYVNDAQLLAEYQQADVLALPSLYEGFGLPVVEAMACGTPVVCSNRGALPEVAGDAALLVNPSDSSALAHALQRVLSDPCLAGNMITRGRQQAAKFTWAATAHATLQAYWQALSD